MKYPIAIAVALAFALVNAFIADMAINEKSCHSKWSDSGYASRWDFWSGCRIEITPKVWIPAKHVAVIA